MEADYETWRKYGINKGIHGSILTYLDIKKGDFYCIENTVDGKSYVTARGWEDLSETIYLYEEQHFPVDETLIGQYLRNKRIAREFASYYDLYQKYKKDYRVQQILSGEADKEIKNRAKQAGFDERLSLMGLLLDALQLKIRENVELEDAMRGLLKVLKQVKSDLGTLEGQNTGEEILAVLQKAEVQQQTEMEQEDQANALSLDAARAYHLTIQTLQNEAKEIRLAGITDPQKAFVQIKEHFNQKVQQMRQDSVQISKELSNLFAFVEKIFGDGNEMLVLVTDLTVNYNSAKFISQKGCKEYYKYNKKFQIYERQQEIADVMEQLQI